MSAAFMSFISDNSPAEPTLRPPGCLHAWPQFASCSVKPAIGVRVSSALGDMVSPLVRDPPWVFKKARGNGPKDGATNVSEVSYPTGLHLCHRPGVQELRKKPKAD